MHQVALSLTQIWLALVAWLPHFCSSFSALAWCTCHRKAYSRLLAVLVRFLLAEIVNTTEGECGWADLTEETEIVIVPKKMI